MILPYLDKSDDFPDCRYALKEPDGLLCYGGDLSTQRLIQAYARGIFPWYSEGEPIMWWCPSDRMVLLPNKLHVSRSLKKTIKKLQPKFFFNRNFKTVIEHCAQIPRKDNGTWILPEMIDAYHDLFKTGHAFCLEVELAGQLIGGIYGVTVGQIYCGESMFSSQANGSKYALYGLCNHMIENNINLLDCQLYNSHLASMGAGLISRAQFIQILEQKKPLMIDEI